MAIQSRISTTKEKIAFQGLPYNCSKVFIRRDFGEFEKLKVFVTFRSPAYGAVYYSH